jgi:hypothetical protein
MLTEVVMTGTLENDYPNGDYVLNCVWCHKDFHGHHFNRVCHKCNNRPQSKSSRKRRNKKTKNRSNILDYLIIGTVLVLTGVLLVW